MVEFAEDRFLMRGRLLSVSREQAIDDQGELSPSSSFGHLDGFPLRHHGAVDREVSLRIHGPLKPREGGRHLLERELPGTWRFPPLRETHHVPGESVSPFLR